MSDPQTPNAPGIYTQDIEGFPPSTIAVPTSVPAFVGYTEKADVNGTSVFLTPVQIQSLAEYEAIFGKGLPASFDMVQVVAPNEVESGSYDITSYDPATSTRSYYRLVPENSSLFYLYNSIQLFYANGGGTAYVVSVGDYTQKGTKIEEDAPDAEAANSDPTPEENATENIVEIEENGLDGEATADVDPEENDSEQSTETEESNPDTERLLKGLNVIADQVGPTMLVVPDAVALPNDNDGNPWDSGAFQTVVRAMIEQSGQLADRMAILDVYGTEYATGQGLQKVITRFHEDVGDNSLSYGAAYFPWLQTIVVSSSEINYTNIAPNSQDLLKQLLTEENAEINNGGVIPAEGESGSAKYEKVNGLIAQMWSGGENAAKVNTGLLTNSPLLTQIENIMLGKENVLPPSGAMAGIWTKTDQTLGVWNAPAGLNASLTSEPTIPITNQMQQDLNVPIDGKAVNAIRTFTLYGTVVWGARTLDGNNPDWRYIQVRRTLIYIEQSIKNMLNQFVFAANDGQTWATVTSMISSFLSSLWAQGGLMGDKASDSFTVQCGLGSTMTGQDILDGYMIVQVTLQMIRPAEFIELTFTQKMEGV